ncbi:hypothetical protein [Natrinema salifodinae]|uniref:Uncharacterized protein n=1 Tax=Natrinema salifodinae TaxID=1202768 RepID=A0A1I0N2L5_9EURY|nr:hypothetical protein [Natrinema salifodinae]SEV95055.1 hypothetical protein SAMN05216285_1254 [Natrinema salifodinae]
MVESTSEDQAKPVSDSETGRLKQWLLLDGNRFAVAIVLAVAFWLTYMALSLGGVAPLTDLQSLFYAFSGLISGNFTLITVVVSINQLLLSRELKSPGELESDIEETVDYRQEIESVANRTAPAEPSGFLRLVVESARRDAQRLGGIATTTAPADAGDEIDEIVSDLTDEFDRIDRLVQESDSGIFNTLSTMLETNFAHEIRRLDEVRRTNGDALSAEADAAIDDLLDRLRELDIARQYFKSVYLQVELSRLSRYLFYAGIPAVGVALGALFVLTGLSGPPLGRSVRAVVFPAAVAVGTFPLALLFSYILRTATVTERTAAITPFTTPEQEV